MKAKTIAASLIFAALTGAALPVVLALTTEPDFSLVDLITFLSE